MRRLAVATAVLLSLFFASSALAANGRIVAYDGGWSLVSVNPDGTDEQTITSDTVHQFSAMTATADGQTVVGEGRIGDDPWYGIWKVDVASGAATFVGAPGACDRSPAVSPDGKWIAFVRMAQDAYGGCDDNAPASEGGLLVMAADGTGTRQLAAGWLRDGLSWSPDSTRIAANDYPADAVIVIDAADGSISPVTTLDGGWATSIGWSSDGDSLFVDRDHTLFEVGVESGTSAPVGGLRGDNLKWAPDGRMVAFTVPHQGLHIARIDNGTKTCDVELAVGYSSFAWLAGDAVMPPACHSSSADLLTPVPETSGALLSFYAPELRYSAQESYFADAANMVTDNHGTRDGVPFANRLIRRAIAGESSVDQELASADPDAPQPLLTLASLSGGPYPWPGTEGTSNEPTGDDVIDESNDYVEDAAAFHADPSYADHIYGRVVTGADGATWLQYWFFYYYNDFDFAGIGVHEGDWEGVQVRLDADHRVDRVIYNKHTGSQACSPDQIAPLPNGAPKVFVALGSHASYPAAGSWNTDVPTNDDHAAGDGPSVRPTVQELSTETTPWVFWPGRWGGSGASPSGPGFKSAWADQAQWAQGADGCFSALDTADSGPDPWDTGASASRVHRRNPLRLQSATIVRGRVVVRYALPALAHPRKGWPKLVLSLDPPGEGPVRTVSTVAHAGKASFTLPFKARASARWKVLASVLTPDGHQTSVRHVVVRRAR